MSSLKQLSRTGVAVLIMLMTHAGFSEPLNNGQTPECVVLVHGLARTANAMNPLQQALHEAGYQVVNHDYPSRDKPVEQLAPTLSRAIDQCGSKTSVHFVTHSMGGILVRYYLSRNTLPRLGRVVMLAPPNQGSEVVDKLGEFAAFEWINGPAGLQLGTGPQDLPRQLPPADYPLGIIAGNHTVNLLLSQLLPKPNDGKVSVASTYLEGMTDHLEVEATHTFMMRNDTVIEQVKAFLRQGHFNHVPLTQ